MSKESLQSLQNSASAFDPYHMLRLVSRTFALGIEQLPGILRDSICAAYLMFRVSDFLEDNEEMTAEQKVELLNLWVEVLDDRASVDALTQLLADTNPDDPEAAVARQADEVLKMFATLPPEIQMPVIEEVRECSLGMARWQARGPVVENEEDLDDYMFEVAGRVGHMLTHVFAWHAAPIRELKDQLMPLAREFGLALQTVNVIRGLRKDFERGWIFVPQSFAAEVGLQPPDLFKPENLEKSMAVLDKLVLKAERHLRNGLEYIKMIPRRYHRIRMFCAWPLFFAVATLSLSRSNRQVLEQEAKITREQVKQIMIDTQQWGWSNRWLDQYYNQLCEACAEI
ncbi:MAG: squalene/phytoene synthase family protein [Chloroflexi bacterium]|nr:squalene/phytoene synthase family protein [Chloroflexota bacterium]